MLLWTLLAPATAAAAADPGFANQVRAHLQVTGNETHSLGPHIATITNRGDRALDFRLLRVVDRPAQGNGLQAEIGDFRLAPAAQQQIPYVVFTNAERQDHPFGMSRIATWKVSPADSPVPATTVTLVLSAHLDVGAILQVAVPRTGEDASYTCTPAELEHTPPRLRPVHCRNALPDAQAGAYPLNVYLAPLDPQDQPYIRPLWVDRLYRTRYVDGRVEPLNCPCECEVDFGSGKRAYSFLPANPRLGYVLEPVVPGLPWIGRRMHGDEPDVVLEVERRPDLMDPLTRVDTVHAACIGADCGADAGIVIDDFELVDDLGHGFATPPPGELWRYAPDGALAVGMTLSPAGPRNKAEVVFRITEASQGSYVESHYRIRYHGRDGVAREFTSQGFGGVLEPDTRRKRSAQQPAGRLRADPPSWVHDQLPGPFVRLRIADAFLRPGKVDWATPPLQSQLRLISVMTSSPYGGSGSVIGMPALRGDGSLDSFRVLTALHLLVPLFHNGLSAEEYTRRYTAPIEVVLSQSWFDDAVDWYDPAEVQWAGSPILGHAFGNQVNARIDVSALPLADQLGMRIPDILVYTVHPDEHLRVTAAAFTGLPVLDYAIAPSRDNLEVPTTMVGYPGSTEYRLDPQDPSSPAVMPMVSAQFPVLRYAPDPPYPMNSRPLVLAIPGAFRYSILDPHTTAPIADGDDLLVFHGFSGAPVLTNLQWMDDALLSATVHGVLASVGTALFTQESYLNYTGLDVDMSSLDAQIYYEWLNAKLS